MMPPMRPVGDLRKSFQKITKKLQKLSSFLQEFGGLEFEREFERELLPRRTRGQEDV